MQSYTIFSLNDLQYGIDTSLVKEVFLLPEITSIDNAPQDIIGVLNLRSQLIPIMDLNLRFGHPIRQLDITKEVIVIQWQSWQVGLIVDRVLEVREIASNSIKLDTSYGRERNIADIFVGGTIAVDNTLVMLLNVEGLIRQPEMIKTLDLEAELVETIKPNETKSNHFYDRYLPEVSDLEKKLLQQRAENFNSVLVGEDFREQLPLAIVRLGREYYGFTLNLVQEFTKAQEIYPIPCCPQTLSGNMNWRGDIVTLIDLANILKIDRDSSKSETDVIVIKVENMITGFSVDEVLDVTYLSFDQVKTHINFDQEEVGQYLLGTAVCQDKLMTLLDVEKIITCQFMAVR
jgi:purine-binding chemotaxis protein CheW